MSATLPISSWNWQDEGTSFRQDIVFILLALLLHAPLVMMKLQSVGQTSAAGERLENVDFVEETPAPPLPVAPAPVPQRSFMEKVTHFFKPPPPVPAPRLPEPTLSEQPAEPARPELKAPLLQVPTVPKVNALTGKSAFQDKISASLKPKESNLLSTPGLAPIRIAPSSAGSIHVPTVEDKGNFHLAQSELPQGISDNIKISAPRAAADAIVIPTAKHASAEKASAIPVPVDRGSYVGPASSQDGLSVPVGGLQGAPSIPSRLVTPAIPIDARSRAGNAGTSKTFQERSNAVAPIPVSRPISAGPSQSLAGSSAGSVSGVTPRRPQRSLFQITGELANRKILSEKLPAYPAWAQAKGISAVVVLDFVVSPDGNVLSDEVIVKRTSGYEDLDDRAVEALKQWKFVELSADSNQNQAGTIVFTYALQ